ncbi:hypothetical protein D9M68_970760 [compost metagenome]
MSTCEAAVQRIHHALKDEPRAIGIRQEHGCVAILGTRHDDGEIGAFRTCDQPLAPVNHIVIAITHRCGGEHRRVGSSSGGGLGHGEAGADMALH